MKHKIAILGLAAIAAGSISACGGGDYGQVTAMPSPVVTNQMLDTAQVLIQARQSSETTTPYRVNDGALVLTDTSDATEPASVNGA
ncbi:MAG TPA: hypothetical protein VF848_08610 [Steroidobacteraceae bacterium]